MRAGQWLAFIGAVLVIVGLAGFGFYRIRHGAPVLTTTPKVIASAEIDPFSSLRQSLKGVQLPQVAHGALHGGQANVIVTHEAGAPCSSSLARSRASSGYRRCYDQLLAKDPKARGRVPMVFTISGTGEVSAVNVEEGSRVLELDVEAHPQPKEPRLSNPQLERCMISAFRKLKFPPPEGGVVNVAYPLLLAPE